MRTASLFAVLLALPPLLRAQYADPRTAREGKTIRERVHGSGEAAATPYQEPNVGGGSSAPLSPPGASSEGASAGPSSEGESGGDGERTAVPDAPEGGAPDAPPVGANPPGKGSENRDGGPDGGIAGPDGAPEGPDAAGADGPNGPNVAEASEPARSSGKETFIQGEDLPDEEAEAKSLVDVKPAQPETPAKKARKAIASEDPEAAAQDEEAQAPAPAKKKAVSVAKAPKAPAAKKSKARKPAAKAAKPAEPAAKADVVNGDVPLPKKQKEKGEPPFPSVPLTPLTPNIP